MDEFIIDRSRIVVVNIVDARLPTIAAIPDVIRSCLHGAIYRSIWSVHEIVRKIERVAWAARQVK